MQIRLDTFRSDGFAVRLHHSAAKTLVDGALRRPRGSCDAGRTQSGDQDLARRDRRGAAGEEEMTKADQLVDNAAARLQALADKAAAEGGVTAKVAEPLADDAEFLRKLKPSLIKARAQDEAPTNQKPGDGRPRPPGLSVASGRSASAKAGRILSLSSGSPSPQGS